jgi:two-component system cell cycle sensor histidine kinase/response regulator CckA
VSGTVLVVDDDLIILMGASVVLSSLGYQVLTASSGEGALRLLQGSQKVDILMTDLRMPGMDGARLAALARQLRPDLAVIVSTAHSAEDAPPEYCYLAKPWGLSELKLALRRVRLAQAAPDPDGPEHGGPGHGGPDRVAPHS